MADIYSMGLDPLLNKTPIGSGAIDALSAASTMVPANAPSLIDGSPVSKAVASEAQIGGDFSDIVFSQKRTFESLVQGFRMGLDPLDKLFKWTLGSGVANFDFSVTTPGAMTFGEPANNSYPALTINRSVGSGAALYIHVLDPAGVALDVLQESNTPGIRVISSSSGQFRVPVQLRDTVATHTNFYEMTEMQGGGTTVASSTPAVAISSWVGNNANPNTVQEGGKGDLMQTSEPNLYMNWDGDKQWVTFYNTAVTSIVAIVNGGTGANTAVTAFNNLSPLTTLGDTLSHNGTGAAGNGDNVRIAGNTTTTIKMLTQTGTGSISAVPVWTDPTAMTTWIWGYSINSAQNTGNLVGLAGIINNNAAALTTPFYAQASNTQSNITFGFQADMGTSGKMAGFSAWGTGSDGVTAESKQFIAWERTDSATTRVYTAGNGHYDSGLPASGYRERFFIRASGAIAFTNGDYSSQKYVSFTPPASIAANVTWTLPNADGTKYSSIVSDGSAVLSFRPPVTTYLGQSDNPGGTVAINWNNGEVQEISLSGSGTNRTFTFSNPLATTQKYMLILEQIDGGSNTVTWPTIYWRGGSPPVLSTTAIHTDIITLFYDGAIYFGDVGLDFY